MSIPGVSQAPRLALRASGFTPRSDPRFFAKLTAARAGSSPAEDLAAEPLQRSNSRIMVTADNEMGGLRVGGPESSVNPQMRARANANPPGAVITGWYLCRRRYYLKRGNSPPPVRTDPTQCREGVAGVSSAIVSEEPRDA
jgi:hypothetical protein